MKLLLEKRQTHADPRRTFIHQLIDECVLKGSPPCMSTRVQTDTHKMAKNKQKNSLKVKIPSSAISCCTVWGSIASVACVLHLSIFCQLLRVTWVLQPLPAVSARRRGYASDKSPVCHGAKDTNNLLHSPIRVLLPISGLLAARQPSRPLNHWFTVTHTHGFGNGLNLLYEFAAGYSNANT